MADAPVPLALHGITTLALLALTGCAGATSSAPEVVAIEVATASPSMSAAAPPAVPPLRATSVWTHEIDFRLFSLVSGIARAPSGNAALLVSDAQGASIFVVSPDGKLVWNTRLSDKQNGYCHTGGVGFDAAGNLFVAGQFATQLEVSGAAVLDAKDDTAFVLSFDAAGSMRWAKAIRGTGIAIPILRPTPRGNSILVAGSFLGDVTLDTHRLEGGGLGDGIAGSLYLSRLSPAGDVEWARAFPGNAMIDELLEDGAGRVVFAGDFFGTLAFDGSPEMSGTDARKRGSYLVTADGAGTPRWAQPRAAQGIAAASDGSLYFCSGPWERFGRKRLGSVLPDGAPRVDGETGLLSCGGAVMGSNGRVLVHGSVAIGEPDPKSGGVQTGTRVLDVTRDGDVVDGLTLPLRSASSNTFAVPDGSGGALLGGIFLEEETSHHVLILYRLSR